MKEKLLERIGYLINKGNAVLRTKYDERYPRVSFSDISGFKAASLAFIKDIFGDKHPYFITFQDVLYDSRASACEAGIRILESIKEDIINGWLSSLRDLVSGEIFSDFLEMGKYLLDENYKDAAAVVTGSALESHLRYLCTKNDIDTFIKKGEKNIYKKAEMMNVELCKASVYGMPQQKNITAWLEYRNKAAHGKYDEYNKEDIRIMHQGIMNFVSSFL
jgi:hypothetical protein